MGDGITLYAAYDGANTVLSGTCDPSYLMMNAISILPKSQAAPTWAGLYDGAQDVFCRSDGTWSTAYTGYRSLASMMSLGRAAVTRDAAYTVRIYPCVTNDINCRQPAESYDVNIHIEGYGVSSATVGGNSSNRKIQMTTLTSSVSGPYSQNIYIVLSVGNAAYNVVESSSADASINGICSTPGTFSATDANGTSLCRAYKVVPFGTAATTDRLISLTGTTSKSGPGWNYNLLESISINLGPIEPSGAINFIFGVGTDINDVVKSHRYVQFMTY